MILGLSISQTARLRNVERVLHASVAQSVVGMTMTHSLNILLSHYLFIKVEAAL